MLTPEQLANRGSGLGGSDAGVVAGVSSRMTALELYMLKRGELIADEDEGDVLGWLGNAIEPVTDQWYERETGYKTRRSNVTHRHKDMPHMLGHVDRLVIGQKRLAEYKMRVHPDGWGPSGGDEIPDDVLCQVQHYMEVLGYEMADVVALIGGREFRLYEIPRDQTIIDSLVAAEDEFWLRVEHGFPPPIDYEHKTSPALLSVIYDGTDGRMVPLNDDALSWVEVWNDARTHISRYNRVKDAARCHLDEMMGMAAIGNLPDGTCLRRSKVARGDGYFDLSHKKQRIG